MKKTRKWHVVYEGINKENKAQRGTAVMFLRAGKRLTERDINIMRSQLQQQQNMRMAGINYYVEIRIEGKRPKILDHTRMKARIKAVQNARDIQGRPGNFDQSEYMRGLYNGLEMASAYLEDRAPEFKEQLKPISKGNEPDKRPELQIEVRDGALVKKKSYEKSGPATKKEDMKHGD